MKDLVTKINEGKGLTLNLQLNNPDEMYGIFNALIYYYNNLQGEEKAYKKDFENAWESLRKAAKDAGIELDSDYDKQIQKAHF